MFGFMVTADGGLTTAGYVITVIAGIILFFLAIYFAGKNSDKKKLTTRQLVFLSLIHISEPTRLVAASRMPSSA